MQAANATLQFYGFVGGVPPVGVAPTLLPRGLEFDPFGDPRLPGVVPREPAPTDPGPAFRAAAAFSFSILGSYKNSQVSYEVCSFTTSNEGPDALLPTPMNGPIDPGRPEPI